MGTHSLIKLALKTPLHFGELMDMEHTEVIMHSDSIFSALCYTSDRFLGKEAYKSFIEPFLKDNPPFLISSAFPYYEISENQTLYFFPKPLLFKEFVDKHPQNIKIFKKIQFVSKDIFNAYLIGDDSFLEEQFQRNDGTIKSDNLIQGNLIWLSENERGLVPILKNIWKIQRNPRICINRKTKETTIFHYSRVYFHKNSGLYILIKNKDQANETNLFNPLFKLFRYLGDTGIGGEKSLGNGQFEFKIESNNEPFTITLNDDSGQSNQFLNLSLYLPKESEINAGIIDQNSFYQVINRRGWISGSSFLRKSINMLIEGSILNGSGKSNLGKLENLTPKILKNTNPNYTIHRYGYCYPINFKI
ncbi:CRISPR system Cms protein Csm4 [subsurface metagenome]